MGVADVVVTICVAALKGGLGWFFFGPHRARTTRIEGQGTAGSC